MAWLLLLALSSLVGLVPLRAGARRRPAEVPNDAGFAVPVAAQAARRGSLRAIIRTTGVVTPASGAEFIAAAHGTRAHR